MREPTIAEAEQREPVLNPVDRVSEMLFGLFMALTFIGAVSVAGRGEVQVRTLFITALGCNLAWGLVDAVMYLVRTATTRGRSHSLILAVRAAPDADAAAGSSKARCPKRWLAWFRAPKSNPSGRGCWRWRRFHPGRN